MPQPASTRTHAAGTLERHQLATQAEKNLHRRHHQQTRQEAWNPRAQRQGHKPLSKESQGYNHISKTRGSSKRPESSDPQKHGLRTRTHEKDEEDVKSLGHQHPPGDGRRLPRGSLAVPSLRIKVSPNDDFSLRARLAAPRTFFSVLFVGVVCCCPEIRAFKTSRSCRKPHSIAPRCVNHPHTPHGLAPHAMAIETPGSIQGSARDSLPPGQNLLPRLALA